ncbi:MULTISPECIES: GlxA family transcriptional regulator [Arthrobacter]|uniref:Helix-turn-helix domain-containing protein n=1 Tax=Arthrobacter terricola TaxID=2547396 RepID=A0A4V2ZRV0_9MICC|nr:MULTISPECIES: DJ-1/PfpI family protein [Arthrobacter]MBT8163491.1 DJ-1/PfpI family protein [Arthrobacter sp. GN70]TDF89464.1 helix-turn-helix domain-containing protein [Arthrobacter terricola]
MMDTMRNDSDSLRRVVVIALDGVVDLDLAIPLQVFARRDLSIRYEVVVAAERPGLVSTAAGLTLHVDHDVSELDEAHTVIVPGFNIASPTSDTVLRALRSAHARGVRLASICTGAFALAAARVLDGTWATTHWEQAAELARTYPLVHVDPDVLYVDNGQVLTSAGVTSGIDLCLHMLELDLGAQAALDVARSLVVPRHRTGGQAQYRPSPLINTGGVIAEALIWASEHATTLLTVEDIAKRAHVSVRSLHRHCLKLTGYPPGEWLLRERVAIACRLLEDPTLTVAAVAAQSGFGSAANMRARFNSIMNTSPAAYRQAFGPSSR